jgi:GH25 family lysozyme M1 (1,4-beta-N-acetylmuramidase)
MTIPLHPTLKIFGPDVSHHQGVIKWDVLASKSSFVIIRVGDGITYPDMKDTTFDFNWKNAKQVGLPRGSYFYFRPEIDPIQQATNHFKHLNGDLGEMELFGDFENNDKHLSPVQVTDAINKYMTKLDSLSGKLTGIYSSPGWWGSSVYAGQVNYSQIDKLNLRTKWVARYTYAMTPYPLPHGWSTWNFWQKSADGNLRAREFGALGSTSIDLNIYNGTKGKFETTYKVELNGSSVDPLKPPLYCKPKVNMRIRGKPSDSFSSPVLGQAFANSVWKISKVVKDTKGRDWFEITENVYLASWLCEYIYEKTIVQPLSAYTGSTLY